MKKLLNILYVLLGFMIILNSCDREDFPSYQIPAESDCPIEFSPAYASLETKTTTTTINNFKVWASRTYTSNNTTQTDKTVFGQTGTKVTKSDDIWAYSPVRYWQPDSYSFYAVSPADFATGSLSDNGLALSFGDNGWDLSADQTDLVLATTSVQGTDFFNKPTSPEPVSLAFDHMLSQISFSARNADPNGVAITVKEVKVYGNSKTATRMSRVLEDNSYKVKWELANTTTSQAPFKALSSLSALLTTGSTVEQGTTKYEYTSLCPAFMFFPEQCDLTFEATIAQKFTNSVNAPEVTKSVKIQKPQNGWVAGKIYNYKLKITAENIVIDIEPEVETWVTKDDNNNDLVVDGPIVM